MGSSVTPQQSVFLNAYEGNLFDFDNINSKVYLTRKINSLLNVFGPNCLIDGFDLMNYVIDDDLNLIVDVSAGKMIIDTTLIEYKQDTQLTQNVMDFDDNGQFIITIGYSYIDTAYTNLSKIGLKYLNTINISNEFRVDYDKMILGVLNFNKITKTCSIDSSETITVNGNSYQIRPPHKINKEFYTYINNILGI